MHPIHKMMAFRILGRMIAGRITHRYHARETYHVILQELPVSAETAERALRMAVGYGAVPQSYCAQSTSTILQSLGYDNIPTTFYPNKLRDAFASYGPTTQELFEYDAADKSKVLSTYNSELVAEQRAARKKAAAN